jgi:hypothetical protein
VATSKWLAAGPSPTRALDHLVGYLNAVNDCDSKAIEQQLKAEAAAETDVGHDCRRRTRERIDRSFDCATVAPVESSGC